MNTAAKEEGSETAPFFSQQIVRMNQQQLDNGAASSLVPATLRLGRKATAYMEHRC
jgi:hypothetical protein